MAIVEILVEIPRAIQEGLNSGEYVRNAAGVIRWASETERAGQIVCHLKETGVQRCA